MGFRCPRCKKDFGNDRDAFQKHLFNNIKCAAKAISIIQDRLETAVKEHKEFSLEEEKEGGEE